MELFRLRGSNVRDLGHRVFVLAIWLTSLNIFEASQERDTIAVKFAFQVVSTEKLHRAVRRLGAIAGDKVECSGERITRRIAYFHPFAGCAATAQRRSQEGSGKQRAESQSVFVIRAQRRGPLPSGLRKLAAAIRLAGRCEET